jgi:hypothetical protein
MISRHRTKLGTGNGIGKIDDEPLRVSHNLRERNHTAAGLNLDLGGSVRLTNGNVLNLRVLSNKSRLESGE